MGASVPLFAFYLAACDTQKALKGNGRSCIPQRIDSITQHRVDDMQIFME